MKTEKFFEIFTELDDELIENALPKENVSKRTAARPVLFRALTIGAAAAAACGALAIGLNVYNKNNSDNRAGIATAPVNSGIPAHGTGDIMHGGATEGNKFDDTMTYPIESGQPAQNPNEFTQIGASMNANGTPSTANADPASYVGISGDWKVYQSVEELVGEPEVIASGKVTDISFSSDKGSLCTIYTVDVATPYKGCSDGTLKFVMYNGLRGYKVEEQLKLLPENAQFIPVYENEPEINIGDEYLFVLRRFNDSMPTIICPEQTAFPLNVEGDDGYRDRFSNASASDIIAYLNS